MIKQYTKKIKKNPRIGLALGGGGARGLAHIAFLKALDELNIRPVVIAGTSMGSLLGGLYAYGHNGIGIERIFKTLNIGHVLTLLDVSLQSMNGVIKGDKVIKMFAELIEKKRFEDLSIPLKVVATDYWERKQVVFEQGKVSDAVRASISVPGIFEPVNLGKKTYVDGGMVNALPYDIIRKECDLLIAIDVLGERYPHKSQLDKPKLFEAVMASFQIMESAQNERKLSVVKPDIYVCPTLENVDILDFRKIKTILKSVENDVQVFKNILSTL